MTENEKPEKTEYDLVTEVIENFTAGIDKVLDAADTVKMKARIERLIAIIMEYRSKVRLVESTTTADRLANAMAHVEWAATAMERLGKANVHNEELAWEICQWAWPPGVDTKAVTEGLKAAMSAAPSVFSMLSSTGEPPPPPDFIRETPPNEETYVGRNAVVGPVPGKPGVFIVEYGDGTREVMLGQVADF